MGRPNIRNKYRKPYRKDIDMEDKNKNPEELPEDAVITEDVNPTVSENEEAGETVAEEAVSLAEENEKLKADLDKEKKEYPQAYPQREVGADQECGRIRIQGSVADSR